MQVLGRAAQKSFRSAVEVALLVLGHQTVLRALAVGVYAVPLLASLWQKRMGECTPINKERERETEEENMTSLGTGPGTKEVNVCGWLDFIK